MKINAAQLRSVLQKNAWQYNALLLFGNNRDLILELTNSVSTKFNDSAQSMGGIKLKYDNIIKNPEILFNEINSIGFFGKNVIIVEDMHGSMNKDIEQVLTKQKIENILIFQASELAPSSGIRKFFEANENLGAVHCFYDDKEAATTINDVFYNKLISYIIYGQKKKVYDEFNQLTASGNNAISIIRMVSSYFLKLYKAHEKLIMQNEYDVLRDLKIFPQQAVLFKYALKKYKPADVMRIITSLSALELKCKSSSVSDKILFESFYINL